MIKKEVEFWKSLPGVPGAEVSTFGRVRTLDRVTPSVRRTYFTKGRVLKQYNDKYGYLNVSIKVDGKWTIKKIHRLVARTFLPNPNGLPMVNHKDCNTKNNNVENLEWCDGFYNQQYRQKYGASQRQPVFAVNLKTFEVYRFQSQHEAGQALGISQGNINEVTKGKRTKAGGFWFTNDDDNTADAIKQKLNEIKHRATLKMH